ncbi:ATP-binding protein [Geobacillus sp. C56-T2]|uniref:sensor histidine kinase n=1 Tax=Geobacillus sp. C56-T2 TaxID=600773 RepID=UPI0011A7BCC9|nr:ATP-binding protein [Geobacillus sp. C56-T2]NNV07204.1 HAMP domain-containing histidine kinase [Geobacillus sp. MMMUD3]TWG30530.1 HAMP domain-containing protein [Geobacillus sp. C56-T2]
MRKLSWKLGMLFFAFVLAVELVLFVSLYATLVHARIEEEFAQLLARGNSHRNVLEKNYDHTTVEHVVMMESEAETDVVITDARRHIVSASSGIVPFARQLIPLTYGRSIPREGMMVETDWKRASHIATVSPIQIGGETRGYVYMFQDTRSIRTMVYKLKHHFVVVGVLSVAITMMTIAFFSRAITMPLLRMKRATEALSRGDFSVRVEVKGDDELARLGKAIQTLANDLAYLKQERSEFLASISHELRTPLTYVKGYADIARRPHLSEKERANYVAIIYEEAEKIEKMVKDLFELAKLERHSFQIETQPTNLCSFFAKLCEKLRPAFQEKSLSLVCQCPSSVTAAIDQERFEQVMINVLDNARKYAFPGTTVEIAVHPQKREIVVAVSDQGVGIPPEDVPRIFERFYRVDKSRSRTSGGTGLGLAIAKEIVEAHGGTIAARSEQGKGTTILMTLPEG